MTPRRRRQRQNSEAVVSNLMLAPMVMALRAPIMSAEAGGFFPMTETPGAVNEKIAAFWQGMTSAQIAWFYSAMLLPVAFAKARSPLTPLLDMAETVTTAALEPAARQVRRNHKRLTGIK
jgi:hypothetical protein